MTFPSTSGRRAGTPYASADPALLAINGGIAAYRFRVGDVSFLVRCDGVRVPFLEGPRLLTHAGGCGEPDVTWSIVGLPEGDPEARRCVPLDQALGRAGSVRRDRGCLSVWSKKTAQAYLQRHLNHLESCAVELFPNSMTLFDFELRELLFITSDCEKRTLQERRIASSTWAPFYPLFSALILHSSAVVRDGRALVFLAPDEGGKTTAARTAPPEAVLSDDQNVVRRESGSWRVHSTPWSLFLGPPRSAPLSAFFRLEKADKFEVFPMSATDLVKQLWQEHRGSFELAPKDLRRRAFDLVCDVARGAPAFSMRLPKGYVDWDALDRAIATA